MEQEISGHLMAKIMVSHCMDADHHLTEDQEVHHLTEDQEVHHRMENRKVYHPMEDQEVHHPMEGLLDHHLIAHHLLDHRLVKENQTSLVLAKDLEVNNYQILIKSDQN